MSTVKFLAILVIMYGCGNKAPLDNEVRAVNVDSINAVKLAEKNNAVTDWDKKTEFTYRLQKALVNKTIAFDGKIVDIFPNEGGLSLQIEGWYNDNYLADIPIDSLTVAKIDQELGAENTFPTGRFIIYINDVSAVVPRLVNKEYSFSYKEGSSWRLTYDFEERIIIIKGRLIDFYIDKN